MRNNSVNKLRKRFQGDDELYRQFASTLEQEHKGEFVAISRDGEIIVSKNDIEVLQRAIEKFGSGNFAFRRIGYKAIGKWRTLIAR